MSTPLPIPPNEAFAWLLFLLGMVSGAILGLRFQEEKFLGGYASRPRRLLRLGHISFFGLGAINLFFAQSLARADLAPHWASIAGWLMILGGIAMPLCCAINAWRARFQPLFAVPVLSLTTGVIVLLTGLVQT